VALPIASGADVYFFLAGNYIDNKMDLKQPKSSHNLFHVAKQRANNIQQNVSQPIQYSNTNSRSSNGGSDYQTSASPKPTPGGYAANSIPVYFARIKSRSNEGRKTFPRAPAITTTRSDRFKSALGKDLRRVKDYTKFSFIKAKRDYNIWAQKHPNENQALKYTVFPFTGIMDGAKGIKNFATNTVPQAAQQVTQNAENKIDSLIEGVEDAASSAGKDIVMGMIVIGLGVYAFWGPVSSAGKTIGEGAKFVGTQTFDLAKSAAPLTPLLLV
jgi:hypothetical protein